MKWDQLAGLYRTGLFDIQSHTYWHPNFKTERRRLSPDAFQSFLTMQFAKPRAVLKDKLGVDADMLAWPFGIYDDELIAKAREAGYLVLDSDSGARFASMLPKAPRAGNGLSPKGVVNGLTERSEYRGSTVASCARIGVAVSPTSDRGPGS